MEKKNGIYETELDPSKILYAKSLKVASEGDENDVLIDVYS